MSKVSINALNAYRERINALTASPTDMLTANFTRQIRDCLLVDLQGQIKGLTQAINDPHVSDKKKAKRERQLAMVQEAITALNNATKL